MSDDEDDEALTWAGGRDPSHYETPVEKTPKPRSRRVRPGSPSAADDTDAPARAELGSFASSALLVSLGILAGVYLLYTTGWLVAAQHMSATRYASTVLEQVAFALKEGLAIAAPVAWYAATIFLTRRRRPVVRLLWLLLGAALLIPWPFVLGIQNVQ